MNTVQIARCHLQKPTSGQTKKVTHHLAEQTVTIPFLVSTPVL